MTNIVDFGEEVIVHFIKVSRALSGKSFNELDLSQVDNEQLCSLLFSFSAILARGESRTRELYK